MRKTKFVTIAEAGRDQGRKYLITEMPASQAEMWAVRAFLAVARGGVEIPQHIVDKGIVGLGAITFQALAQMDYGEARALLDEMFRCVQSVPDPNNELVVRPLVETDIDEVATRVHLRAELYTLHTGFSLADTLSTLSSQVAVKETTTGSQTTQTSHAA